MSIEPQIDTGQPESTGNTTLVDPVTPAARSSQPQDSRKPVKWVTTKKDLTASFTFLRKKTVSLTSSSAVHSGELEIRQVFSSKEELKEKLSMLAIRNKF